MMKEIYKKALDKTTLPNESKENLKSLYDKVNEKGKVMSFEKKRSKKPLAFVAAGLVCAIAVGSTFALGQFGGSKSGDSKNSFVLNVNAAEIGKRDTTTKSQKSSKVKVTDGGYVISQGDDNVWYYDFVLGVNCDGKNIDEITYSINKGYLFNVADEEQDVSEVNVSDSNDSQKSTVTQKFSELPKDKMVYLDVNGSSDSLSKADQEFLNKGLIPSADVEQYKKAVDILLKDLKITVTAKFNDSTTEEETINVNSKVSTLKEMAEAQYNNIAVDEDSGDNAEVEKSESLSSDETYIGGYEGKSTNGDEKDVYISFEVEK